MEIKEINPNFVRKLKVLKMDLEKDLYTLKQACIDTFNQEISSIRTEISSLESGIDKNPSSVVFNSKIWEENGCGTLMVVLIVFSVITSYTGLPMALSIIGLIVILDFAYLCQKRNENYELKLKIDKRRNDLNLLEKHWVEIFNIK